MVLLSESETLNEAIQDNHINNWKLNDDIILSLIDTIKESEMYQEYMQNLKGVLKMIKIPN